MNLNNKRKKYFQLDNITHDDVFALLETVDSDAEQDIDDLMNDSDTEFIAEDDILEGDVDTDYSITTPNANIHVSTLETSEQNGKSVVDFTNHRNKNSVECTSLSSTDEVTEKSSSSNHDQATENAVEEQNRVRKSTETKTKNAQKSTKISSTETNAKIGQKSAKKRSKKTEADIAEKSAKRKATKTVVNNVGKKGASQGEKGKKIIDDEWKWKTTGEIEEKIESSLSPDVLFEFGEDNVPIFVFETVSEFTELIQLIVEQSNIYASQNGRIFVTDVDEMKAFIGINYIMGINKLPSLAEYWRVDEFVGNDGIKNVTTRKRFLEILKNLHFVDNTKRTEESSKSFKIDPVIEHLNAAFKNAVAEDPRQSIDEHMIKFKGRSSMKQYIKSKPIKWGFKAWMRCASSTGYAYHFELYTGKAASSNLPVGESVVLRLVEGLKNTHATIFFDNFFSSPTLIQKLFDDGLYGIGTVRKDRKHMPNLKADKELKRGESQFLYHKNVMVSKWMDNRGVLMVGSAVDEFDTTSTVQRRAKGSATKATINCPNLIKLYNAGMGGVDLLDQRVAAYRLDRKSKFRFYLRIFFDLMDIACTNGFIVFNMLYPEKKFTTLDFKVAVAKSLIGRYNNRLRSVKQIQPTKRIETTAPLEEPPHLPEFMEKRGRCEYCKVNDKENRTFVKCTTCYAYLCLVKERNCFLLHHMA